VYLTRCRTCSSRLLQLDRLWLLADGQHVARRRCPECETVDHVTADPTALWAWRRESQRQLALLESAMLELAARATELAPLPSD
jgi:hypothetical protein